MENKYPRSLYYYTDEFLMLLDSIEDKTDPEAAEALRIAEENVKGKCVNYRNRITENDGLIDTIDAEILRLQNRKKSIVSESERLKKSLLNAVELFGKENPKSVSKAKEMDFDLFTVTWTESKKMVIQDANMIPPDMMESIPPSEQPDNAKIKAELLAGREVSGAMLITNRNIQIK